MRILHCCLAAFFIDNFGYQENILPKMHKIQGHDVQIVASTETYVDQKKLGYVKPGSYFTNEEIKVTRLPYVKLLPSKLVRKLRLYVGLTKLLEEFKPEIIFLHDVQFLSIREIVAYVKSHNVIVYADSHTDSINSAKNWISLNILHGIVYRYCVKLIEPYIKRFYGTLPLRNKFLTEVYGVNENKIELLPLGVDDSVLKQFEPEKTRSSFRERLGFAESDFIVVSGGKIDRRKNIHFLLDAFRRISCPQIKLILFGSVADDIKNEIDLGIQQEKVSFLGWLPPEKIFEVLLAADLGFFPGTHSVLWEQCVGTGLPCVFKKWVDIQHVDIGGNCRFIEDTTPSAIESELMEIFENKKLWQEMKSIATLKGVEFFSYSKLAKFAIDH